MTIAGIGSAGLAAADTVDSITPTATSVYAGQTLTVNFTYSSADANLGAWIGLYAPGSTPGVQGSSEWAYVNGNSQTEPSTGTPVTSGSVTLPTAGLAPGTYTLYEFKDDGYDIVGSQVTVTVLAPALSTTTTTVTAGQPLTFSYTLPVRSGEPHELGRPVQQRRHRLLLGLHPERQPDRADQRHAVDDGHRDPEHDGPGAGNLHRQAALQQRLHADRLAGHDHDQGRQRRSSGHADRAERDRDHLDRLGYAALVPVHGPRQ